MRRFALSEEEAQAIRVAEAAVPDKRLRRALQALLLRHEGMKLTEIGERLGLEPSSVSRICRRYRTQGLTEFTRRKYADHCRLLSRAEEAAVLSDFARQARAGEIIRIRDIQAALNAACGRDTAAVYVYAVLHRHSWHRQNRMDREGHPILVWVPEETEAPQP